MQIQKQTQNQNFFRENYLVFGASEILAGITKLSPADRNNSTINPPESIAEFVDEEAVAANKAMQYPVKNIYTKTKNAALNVVKGAAEIPQAILHAPALAAGYLQEKTAHLAANVVDFTVAAPTAVVSSGIALVGNVQKYLADMLIKIPSSVINIFGSLVGTPGLKASEYARRGEEYINNKGHSVTGRIRSASTNLRSSMDNLTLPGVGQLRAMAA